MPPETEPSPVAEIRARIESIGVELPKGRLSTADLLANCKHGDAVDLEWLTGVQERRVCGENDNSRTLAIAAARNCLARSAWEAEDLDCLIFCGITTYVEGFEFQLEPQLSTEIASAIGATHARTFDVANACAGMLTGVTLLEDAIARGSIKRGMVVSGEWITHLAHNARMNVDRVTHPEIASLTVGDSGAAAIVEGCSPDRGLQSSIFVTLAEYSDLCVGKGYPDGPGAFMLTDAADLHRIAIMDALKVVQSALAQAGIPYEKIAHLIAHQTSARALRAGDRICQTAMGTRGRKFRENLSHVGNTSTTSHFLA
ncbi:MAG: 3-oxoacyl-ACP synthase, partial [Planctomycetes bacterium]|nr:3-oxoacyl-ACP synthase [Planctomycetota bacterium]